MHSASPERQHIAESFGVKVWDGERWELMPWDEWAEAQGRSSEEAHPTINYVRELP